MPRVWPGETIVCIGTGPSLTSDQVNECRDNCRTIVVNDAYKLAPWADVLYSCDARWWIWHNQAPNFLGVKVGLAWDGTTGKMYPQWHQQNLGQIRKLASTGDAGLEIVDPRGLRNGRNSGYQAINLAVHLGAGRVVLLGYDMKRTNGKNHFFGDHPGKVPAPPFGKFRRAFKSLKNPLKDLGIDVLNATPGSALNTFPMVDIEEAI